MESRDVKVRGIDYRLHLVTDDYYLETGNICQAVEEALKSGVTVLQYRAKNRTGRMLLKEAEAFKSLSLRYGVPLIVNDRLDIALAVDADGLHVGQEDLPLPVARKIFKNKIIGVSATSYEEAREAIIQEADYIGIGPVFSTPTKKDAKPPCGLDVIRRIKADFPSACLIAIGGIEPDTCRQVLNAGADGVAVVSAILGSNDSGQAARDFISRFSGKGMEKEEI